MDPNNAKDANTAVNEAFLSDVSRTEQPAFAAKHALPQTSSQVIGWFHADLKPEEAKLSRDGRVCKPLVHTELSQYMSAYWRFYPTGALLRGSQKAAKSAGIQ